MRSLHNVFVKVLAWASVILFALLVIITTWQVFARQALNDPSTWSEEASRLLFVWLSFLGGAFLFGERGHISVDFLARRLPGNQPKYFQLFVQLMIFLFAVVAMVWGGIVAAQIAWDQNMTALPITIGWAYTVIPIAGVFIAYFALSDFISLFKNDIQPYPEIDEAAGDEIAENPEAIEPTAVGITSSEVVDKQKKEGKQ